MKKKYFQLFRYTNNAVGGDFFYCEEKDLEKSKEEFQPDNVEEVSKEEYDSEIERLKRKSIRFLTGYPK